MEYISTDQVEEGQVVARDVLSSTHMLLVPSGTHLNSVKIQMLKTWGVKRVCIEMEERQESAEEKELKALIYAKIDNLFLHNEENDFIKHLKEVAFRIHKRNWRGDV